jgi:pimeloyl-ACP methyl ester carboxylesterase
MLIRNPKMSLPTSFALKSALALPSQISVSAFAAAQAAPAVSKQAVRFACQQVQCAGELWLPAADAAGRKPPVIVMAHGFGGLKDWGLPAFAERFTKAGFAVMLFDYRGFGASGGQPRRVVDGEEHVKDWLSAVDAMKARTDIDAQRIGIWGSSYSGGHVLKAAALRPGVVRAVSAQVPFVNGFASSLLFPLKYQPLAGFYALRDMLRSDSEEPLYVPTIAKDGFSALICPECAEGYKKLTPPGMEAENKVAARVFLTLPFYNPGKYAKDIQAPVLMLAAEKDGLIPIAKVREVAASLPHGEFVELKGADHFTPYAGPVFEQVVAKQTVFFKAKLAP